MSSEKIVGFIDIGTNSIHLLVVNFIENTVGVEIAREKETVRIGRSLYADGMIDRDAISKAQIVVRRFTEYAKKHGATEIYAFATCATREAENRDELLKALGCDGLDIRVISGEEEARLIRLGVLGQTAPEERTLLIDIGGGSTEMSVSKGKDILFIASLPMGAIRFAYGNPFDPARAIEKDEYDSYQRDVDIKSYSVIRKIKEIGFDRVIGSSGTFETLGEICGCGKKDEMPVITLSSVSSVMEKLRNMDLKHRLKYPKLNESRADIIIAGGAIAEELMALLDINEMFISHSGLKEGMKVDYRINHGIININVRDSSVNELCAKCRCDVGHSIFTKSISMKIFDRMSELGLHDINPNLCSLLGYAAQMHDIGEFISYDKHQLNSYNIIVNSNLLGFNDDELMMMAIMARYHHKKIPSSADPVFLKLRTVTPLEMRQCICILRMADALDRHRSQVVKYVDLSVENNKLLVNITSDNNIDMEIWKLEKSSKDFRALFGIDMMINGNSSDSENDD